MSRVSQPMHNPFYPLVLAACGLLLVTMFIYLMGWLYLAPPDGMPNISAPMPGWMRWVDRNAIFLIAGEIVAILVLTILMISLDSRFEKPAPPTEAGAD